MHSTSWANNPTPSKSNRDRHRPARGSGTAGEDAACGCGIAFPNGPANWVLFNDVRGPSFRRGKLWYRHFAVGLPKLKSLNYDLRYKNANVKRIAACDTQCLLSMAPGLSGTEKRLFRSPSLLGRAPRTERRPGLPSAWALHAVGAPNEAFNGDQIGPYRRSSPNNRILVDCEVRRHRRPPLPGVQSRPAQPCERRRPKNPSA